MTNAISSQMASNLIALTSINENIASTQERLSTGKEVATAADNIAVYFRAKALSDKASGLTDANKQIDLAVKNLGVVDKAIVTIQDNLKGAMQLMKDARAKAVTTTKNAITNGDQKYAYVAPVTGTPTTAAVKEVKGDIVRAAPTGTAAATDADSSAYFQVGDVFALTMADAASGTKTIRYFKAADPTNDLPTTLGDGSTVAKATSFRDLASLADAIQTAFGTDSIDVKLNETTTGPKQFSLGFGLTSSSLSLSAWQAVDIAVNTGAVNGARAVTDPGSPFDFGVLFGKQQNVQNAKYETASVINSDTYTFLDAAGDTKSVTGARTWSALGGKAADADIALETRRSAASFLNQVLDGVNSIVNDAYVSGFANVLRGEKFVVDLNDDGTGKKTLQLDEGADPLSLGFAGFKLDPNGGAIITATLNDFNTDAAMDTALAQIKTALSKLQNIQTIVAANQTIISSRVNFNAGLATDLNTSANESTAADTAKEAVKLAALQTQQSFATNSLSITKQADQSLIQILR